ncbi:hypothetical protein ACAX43_19655 [Paraburkholderia sp. IW21]|uniref:hypothetical protein n=1 Tax=Paraburkholderia sp. IW21 TaxID=3242488 RepID=UPI003522ECC6
MSSKRTTASARDHHASAGFGSPVVILVGRAIGESAEHGIEGSQEWRRNTAAMQAGPLAADEALAQAA